MTAARRILTWGVPLALIAAALTAAGVYLLSSAGPPPPEPPRPALAEADARVVRAIGNAVAAVEENPRSTEMWGELALVFLAHDFPAEADICLEYLTRCEPDEARWWYYRGIAAEQTDARQALASFHNAVQRDPENLAIRLKLARMLIRLGEWDEAETQLRAARAHHPDDPYSALELGRLLANRGQLEEAESLFVRAAQLPAWYARPAWIELTRVRHRLGDVEGTTEAFQQAARFPEATSELDNPLNREIEKRDALLRSFAQSSDALIARGQWQEAIRNYELLIQQRPTLIRPRLNLAHARAMLGQTSQARMVVEEATRLAPDNANTWFALAYILEREGNLADAADAWQKGLQLDQDNAQSWFSLGLLEEERNDLPAARHAYERAVAADPRHAPAHLALGALLEEREEWEAAAEHMRHAVRLAPGDPVPRTRLERLLEKRQRPDRVP